MVFSPTSMPQFVFHAVSSGRSGPRESSERGGVLRALQVLFQDSRSVQEVRGARFSTRKAHATRIPPSARTFHHFVSHLCLQTATKRLSGRKRLRAEDKVAFSGRPEPLLWGWNDSQPYLAILSPLSGSQIKGGRRRTLNWGGELLRPDACLF